MPGRRDWAANSRHNPRVVIIGKQVNAAIGSLIRRDLGINVRVDTINRPNAHMTLEEIALYRRQCFDLGRISMGDPDMV